jgi:hypothetical protein
MPSEPLSFEPFPTAFRRPSFAGSLAFAVAITGAPCAFAQTPGPVPPTPTPDASPYPLPAPPPGDLRPSPADAVPPPAPVDAAPPPIAPSPPAAGSTSAPPPPADVPSPDQSLSFANARSAGYRNGSFYLHSPDDVFRLYIQGRVHADWLGQYGPGVSALPPGSGITEGFYLRRARLELGGEFFQQWQWQVGAEFSSATSIDNAAGQQTTPTCAPSSTGALPCTDKENPVENGTVKPIPTDVFINYAITPWTNIQVGQYYLPYTLENRISDNTTPFLERSLAVRNIGAPLQRDIGLMFWGESPDRVIYYTAAIVNGDGPNRMNVDSRYDYVGRAVLRPFMIAPPAPSMQWSQVGISAKVGSRDSSAVGYDLPSLTTQGGYAFWKPTYKDSLGRTIHIMPSSDQWGIAGDVYLPIYNFDFTGEFIWNVYDTREAVDGYQISKYTERAGELKGYGWYAQIGYWIVGNHDLIGAPTYGRPIHVDLSKPQVPPEHGLQVLAKFEQLALTYQGAQRAGKNDPNTPNGDIRVNTLEFGVNYWATKHLRVGLNYTADFFPSAAPTTASSKGGPVQSSTQRAIAPGQALAAGVDDSARNSADILHEVQARVGVQF